MNFDRWLELLMAGCIATVYQSAQLASLQADDPAGPLSLPTSTISVAPSGMVDLAVPNTTTGALHVADFPAQWAVASGVPKGRD